MTNEQKLQVKDALMRYTTSFDTQAEAAASLQGISASVISQVKNDNWELLSNKLWLHIARQVGFYCGQWHGADTSASLLLRILMGDAQRYGMSYGITMATGLGKTFTASQYRKEQHNILYIAGTEEHNRRSFMAMLMHGIGLMASGTFPEMINQFTATIATRDEPLLIIDDAHLFKDRVLQLVVTIANMLNGVVGVVIMGTDDLRLRITDGVAVSKVGYERMYSAFGKRFVTLSQLSPRDVELVCIANNVTDEATIAHITQRCDGSLHGIPEVLQQCSRMDIAA